MSTPDEEYYVGIVRDWIKAEHGREAIVKYIRDQAATIEQLQARITAIESVTDWIHPKEFDGVPRTERQSGWNDCVMEIQKAIAEGEK